MNAFNSPSPQPVSLSERRVLDHIYSRQSGHVSPRALASLVERGFVLDVDGSLQLTQSGMRAINA